MLEHPPQIFTGRRIMVGGALVLMAIVSFVLLNGSGGTAKASAPTPPSYAAYPALSSNEPTGLPLVTHGSPAAATLGAQGPTFPASPPAEVAGGWPEAVSIRKLSINVSTISAWIAKSIEGGVCVLLSRHQPIKGVYGVAVSCALAANINSTGATVESEVPGSNGVTIAGVVPAGVSSVQVALTDGTSKTVVVSDNAWALETEAHIQSIHDVAGS
jgi:hypothetical protein